MRLSFVLVETVTGERPAHAPGLPSLPLPTLDPTSTVRDVQTGELLTPAEWVKRRSESSGRSEDICLEELINAVARGDVVSEMPDEDPVV